MQPVRLHINIRLIVVFQVELPILLGGEDCMHMVCSDLLDGRMWCIALKKK